VLDGFREQYAAVDRAVDQLAHDRDVFQEGRAQGHAEAERAARDQAEHMRCVEAMRGKHGEVSLLTEHLCYGGQAFERLLSASQVKVAGGMAIAGITDLSDLKLALLQR
jgi:hypothetical protein